MKPKNAGRDQPENPFPGSGIGLLNEKALHRSLKQWYGKPGDRFEVPVGSFVIDIVRDGLLIEIQLGNVSGIRSKLAALALGHRVRLVYPVITENWILRPQTSGHGPLVRRKSPRKGRLEDVFRQTVSIPQLLFHENFSLHVLMIRTEETRRWDPKRRWKRGGWAVEERRLLDVLDERLFEESADWQALLPRGLDLFTTKDLAGSMAVSLDLAQKLAFCLRQGGLIDPEGRRGRFLLYKRRSP